jgi:hypothetical protein
MRTELAWDSPWVLALAPINVCSSQIGGARTMALEAITPVST